MVIEGIITTENPDGSMHVAPIGPHVNESLTEWTLKPFQSSTTFANLRQRSRCVFHVVDDALLMAAAVMGLCSPGQDWNRFANDRIPLEILSQLARAHFENDIGWILDDACTAYSLNIQNWDVTAPRAIAECRVTTTQQLRPFWGWNRAKNSILELAIVASRLHMLERDAIEAELKQHEVIIAKTAGPRELAAWNLLSEHINQTLSSK